MNKLAILGGTPVGSMQFPNWPIYDTTDINAVAEAVKSGVWGFKGERQTELERRFADYCNASHCISASNGTVTLRLALEALGVGPGDEVIVPGFTWQATAAVVLDVNACPILVDVDPDTYTIDPKAVEAAITERTKCIIPVHLYGRMADMDALKTIADKHGLFILEDCAHQHGSRWDGRAAGTIGDIGSFSLQSSKIFNTGEGGLLTTNDQRLSDILYSLRSCGRPVPNALGAMQSGNYRLSEFQAAIGITQLVRLEAQNELRERNAAYIEQQLAGIEGIRPMFRHPKITRQAYYNFTLRYEEDAWEGVRKERFMEALVAEVQNSAIGWITYEPLNNSPMYQPHNKKTHKLSEEYWARINPSAYQLPVAEKAYYHEAMNFMHNMLLTDQAGCDIFVQAIRKIREQSGQLQQYAAAKA